LRLLQMKYPPAATSISARSSVRVMVGRAVRRDSAPAVSQLA
jgi:hypothetical protein